MCIVIFPQRQKNAVLARAFLLTTAQEASLSRAPPKVEAKELMGNSKKAPQHFPAQLSNRGTGFGAGRGGDRFWEIRNFIIRKLTYWLTVLILRNKLNDTESISLEHQKTASSAWMRSPHKLPAFYQDFLLGPAGRVLSSTDLKSSIKV